MNPIVHGMIAWIAAVLLQDELRDRRLVVVMGVIPDSDAILIFVSEELFYEYHHTIGHSFIFCIPLAILFAFLSIHRLKVFFGCIAVFALHIVADFYGSNWPMPIFYPFSDYELNSGGNMSYHTIYEVINPAVGILAVIIVLFITHWKERSPFEFISENLDRKLVGLYIFPLKYRCTICSGRAFIACDECGERVCPRHIGFMTRWICSVCTRNMKRI